MSRAKYGSCLSHTAHFTGFEEGESYLAVTTDLNIIDIIEGEEGTWRTVARLWKSSE